MSSKLPTYIHDVSTQLTESGPEKKSSVNCDKLSGYGLQTGISSLKRLPEEQDPMTYDPKSST